MSQPQKMLVLNLKVNFEMEHSILIFCSPNWNWLLLVQKFAFSFSTLAKNVFNSFVQSVVYARRSEDQNTISSVVADTRKLQANSSFGC